MNFYNATKRLYERERQLVFVPDFRTNDVVLMWCLVADTITDAMGWPDDQWEPTPLQENALIDALKYYIKEERVSGFVKLRLKDAMFEFELSVDGVVKDTSLCRVSIDEGESLTVQLSDPKHRAQLCAHVETIVQEGFRNLARTSKTT